MIRPQHITRELAAIKALFAEGMERTSRLEAEIAPFQERSPRKGRTSEAEAAVNRRNQRIRK